MTDRLASSSSSAVAMPIALPVHHARDVHMASPSSFAHAFSPASYTRAAIGASSPASWRPSSFGPSHPFASSSPGQQYFVGSYDINAVKLSSSIESDRAGFHRSQDELCRNYTCCGLSLPDLHALVDHFEEAHVVVLDPSQSHNPSLLPNALPHMHAVYAQQLAQQQQQLQQHSPLSSSPYTSSTAYHYQQQQQQQQQQHGQVPSQHHAPQYHLVPAPVAPSFDPADDMELDVDTSPASSSPSSPPHTPPFAHAPAISIQTQVPYVPAPYSTLSSQPSSACPSPVSAFDTTAVLPSRAQKQAFNAYPAFSTIHDGPEQRPTAELGVAPAMLFGNQRQQQIAASSRAHQRQQQQQQSISVATAVTAAVAATATHGSPLRPKASPREMSSVPSSPATTSAPTPAPSPPAHGRESPRASTTLSRPASSLLLSKPFRCPKPNCSKSYKQANGLKYHMTHGSCSFAPPKDYEAVQALLAEKGLDGAGTLSESDAREVEREAERRLRPFACGVADCARRYKNMNGLRYHYQHSGEHGAEGLRLLASGQHECLQHHTGRAKPRPSAPVPAPARGQGSPSPAPSASVPVSPAPVPTQGGQQWYGQQYAWQQQQQQQQQQAAAAAQVHI